MKSDVLHLLLVLLRFAPSRGRELKSPPNDALYIFHAFAPSRGRELKF